MKSISYAQNFEDVMLARALADVEHGFYVDVGAQDPVIDSVTNWFYTRGWKGINIEPVPHWFERLQADRPRDTNLMCAVASAPGTLVIHESVDSGLSTANEDYARGHMAEGRQMIERAVPARRLDDILAEHAPAAVHFLKIDVEGMEADVLASLSLQLYRPWILVVEATRPNTDIDVSQTWEPSVVAANYCLVYRDGLNRFYLAQEHMSRAPAFDVPPNIFDNVIHYREHASNEYAGSLEGRIQELHDTAQRLREDLATTGNVVDNQRSRLAELDKALQDRQAILEETARQAETRRVDLLAVAATAEAQKIRLAELDEVVRDRQSALEKAARQAEAWRVDLLAAASTAEARQTRIAELETELSLAHLREAGAQRDLQEVARAAENRRLLAEQLEARVRQADAQLQQLAIELHATSLRAGGLSAELERIYASRSWRMTAPLRRVGQRARSGIRSALRGAAGTPLLRRLAARFITGGLRERVLRLAGFGGQEIAYPAGPAPDPVAPSDVPPLSRSAARVYRLLEQAQAKAPLGTDEDPH